MARTNKNGLKGYALSSLLCSLALGLSALAATNCGNSQTDSVVPPRASCDDGILNGDEVRTDCGGDCSACPTTAPQVTGYDALGAPESVAIRIFGTGLSQVDNVDFNGVAAESFSIESDTCIRAVVPPGATTGLVSVSNGAGTAQGPSLSVITGAMIDAAAAYAFSTQENTIAGFPPVPGTQGEGLRILHFVPPRADALEERTVVFERYTTGFSASTPHKAASGTKSWSGVLLAAALMDGLIESPDELVSDTITEWQSDAFFPEKADITIEMLLRQVSGLDDAVWGADGSPPAISAGMTASFSDAIHFGLKSKAGGAYVLPGEVYNYTPINFQVFGELLRRKLQGTMYEVPDPTSPVGNYAPTDAYLPNPLHYLKVRVLDPMQTTWGTWRTALGFRDPDLAGGGSYAPEQWEKLGILLASDGVDPSEGRLLRSEDIASLFQATTQNTNYGLTFWLGYNAGPPDWGIAPPTSTYYAGGSGGQRMYVMPAWHLIIVRFGVITSGNAFYDSVFWRLLGIDG